MKILQTLAVTALLANANLAIACEDHEENNTPKNSAVRPEDILSDDASHTSFNGVTVRKGSIAAFLKNIEVIENTKSTKENKEESVKAMKELAPALVAVGVDKHVTFKNKTAQSIIEEAAKNSKKQ
jgi:hypothetical protein